MDDLSCVSVDWNAYFPEETQEDDFLIPRLAIDSHEGNHDLSAFSSQNLPISGPWTRGPSLLKIL